MAAATAIEIGQKRVVADGFPPDRGERELRSIAISARQDQNFGGGVHGLALYAITMASASGKILAGVQRNMPLACTLGLRTFTRMPWNDAIFRREIETAAAAVNKKPTAIFVEAGVGKSGLGTQRVHGPRMDLFEKLMPVLGWSPADVQRVIAACFGWETSVDPASPPAKGEVRIVLRNVEIRVLSEGAEEQIIPVGSPASGTSK